MLRSVQEPHVFMALPLDRIRRELIGDYKHDALSEQKPKPEP
jgi:hypothetical protein